MYLMKQMKLAYVLSFNHLDLKNHLTKSNQSYSKKHYYHVDVFTIIII